MKNESFKIFVISILVIGFAHAQPDLTFEIDNPPTEVCDDKTVTFKMKENEDFPCSFDDVEWFISDYSSSFNSQATGKQFTFWPQYGTSLRTFKVKAKIVCSWEEENDQGDPVQRTETFEKIKSIKIVHPDFFQLSVIGGISCSANSFEFRLRDPSGTLDGSSLDKISWVVPSSWSITSGATSATMVVNTQGNAEGSHKVKVKYEAIASKVDPVTGFPFPTKCIDKREIEANFNISACRATISYPPSVASHPSSHSSNRTNFGFTTLSPNHYNFASGQSHQVNNGFNFMATANSSLHLFIEECGCSSPWHDPNLMGSSTVDINNPYVGAARIVGVPQTPIAANDHVIDGGNSTIEESKVQVYPNPFGDELTISNLPPGELLDISVESTSASNLLKLEKMSSEKGDVQLNLRALNPGLYILKVRFSDELVAFRIVKN